MSLGHPALGEWIEMDGQVKACLHRASTAAHKFLLYCFFFYYFLFLNMDSLMLQQVSERNQARMKTEILLILILQNL